MRLHLIDQYKYIYIYINIYATSSYPLCHGDCARTCGEAGVTEERWARGRCGPALGHMGIWICAPEQSSNLGNLNLA